MCHYSTLRGDISLGLYNRVIATKEAVTVQVSVIQNLPVLVRACCLCLMSSALAWIQDPHIYMDLPCLREGKLRIETFLLETSDRQLAGLQKACNSLSCDILLT